MAMYSRHVLGLFIKLFVFFFEKRRDSFGRSLFFKMMYLRVIDILSKLVWKEQTKIYFCCAVQKPAFERLCLRQVFLYTFLTACFYQTVSNRPRNVWKKKNCEKKNYYFFFPVFFSSVFLCVG